jgi:hypothetical protein
MSHPTLQAVKHHDQAAPTEPKQKAPLLSAGSQTQPESQLSDED